MIVEMYTGWAHENYTGSTQHRKTDYGKGHIYKHSKKIHENVITRGAMGTQKLIQVETQAQRATKYSN